MSERKGYERRLAKEKQAREAAPYVEKRRRYRRCFWTWPLGHTYVWPSGHTYEFGHAEYGELSRTYCVHCAKTRVNY